MVAVTRPSITWLMQRQTHGEAVRIAARRIQTASTCHRACSSLCGACPVVHLSNTSRSRCCDAANMRITRE